MKRAWLTVVLGLLACMAEAKEPAGKDVVSGTANAPVANFTLPDFRGKDVSLADFSDRKLVVIAVMGTECPLAQKYLPMLQTLADKFSKEAAFLGINANRQDSLAEIGAQVRNAKVSFPMLKDNQLTAVTALGATRTPEVFVLDQQRNIRYRGRIDDQHSVGNRSKSSPTRDDLRIAIEELLAGKPVSVPKTDAVGCLIMRGTKAKSDAPVTFSHQISRLLQKHCVECHRPGEIAPFSLTEYSEAAGWADMMVEVTQNGQMPPWHAAPEHGTFRNARVMTDEEKQLLVDWAEAGAPEGDVKQLPPAPEFSSGWHLPQEPDLVVAMRDKPYSVPATGTVRYQYFTVDPHIDGEKWVKAAEIIPGNRTVVHHVIVFATQDPKKLDSERNYLTAYVPGMQVAAYPPGYAKRIPPGSKLIFQMHYTTNGTAQEDLTKIGIVFEDETKVTHEVRTESINARPLLLVPNKDDQRFSAKPITAPVDMELLSMMPHMHLRGKSFRYEAAWPDGRKDVLLDVPRYDFNWQTSYEYAEPMPVPKGTVISAFASFDNSANNLANPDPGQVVHWGEQTWNEMMLASFDIAIPRTREAREALAQIEGILKPQDQAKKLITLLDRNKNEALELDEVPPRQKSRFEQADINKDGKVTLDELSAIIVDLREDLKSGLRNRLDRK